ncbi:MAG: hypothetical protein OIF32_00955 [Campylobacterales bacterium]|nr:hypothetical protein [Campylobacterales bacterium]
MKKIISIVLLSILSLGANEGVLEYQLKDDGKEIGFIRYQGFTKKGDGNIYALQEIKFLVKALLFSFRYDYKESVNILDDGSISFSAYENIDGDKKKVHGVIKDNSVIYKDGTILDISNIDSIPFLLTSRDLQGKTPLKNFSVKTFDVMKKSIKVNSYEFLERNEGILLYKMDNSLDKEGSLVGFDNEGNVVYIENNLFQGTIKK